MLKTIIWATDGSENAERALPYAEALLDHDDAMLVAVHITETLPRTDSEPPSDPGDTVARIRDLVSATAEHGRSATARIVSRIGQLPAHQIAEVAREVDADVIVVGTRGHSPSAGLIVGSVTQQLLHIAPCPVFAVPPGVRRPQADASADVVSAPRSS